MKTNSLRLFTTIAAAVVCPVLSAQTPSPAPTQPSAVAVNSAGTATPAPNQIVYAPRLPTPTELTNGAQAQGITLEKVTQTDSQVIAVYRLANGQINTVSYQVLPPAVSSTQGIVVPTTPAPAVAGAAAPSSTTTVVYTPAPPAVYYYYPDSYGYGYGYGWGWYPPVSFQVGLGLGFNRGYRGYGGFHSYGGYHGYHGGWRR